MKNVKGLMGSKHLNSFFRRSEAVCFLTRNNQWRNAEREIQQTSRFIQRTTKPKKMSYPESCIGDENLRARHTEIFRIVRAAATIKELSEFR